MTEPQREVLSAAKRRGCWELKRMLTSLDFSHKKLSVSRGFILAAAVKCIWIDDIVVLFLPLSFYAKKKVAERKARIRGGGAEDARIREHMAAPIPPLMYLPLTAQPIAQRRVIVRNARQALRLAFLVRRMHV